MLQPHKIKYIFDTFIKKINEHEITDKHLITSYYDNNMEL